MGHHVQRLAYVAGLLFSICAPAFTQNLIASFAGQNRLFLGAGQLAVSLPISKVSFVTFDPDGNPVFAIPERNVVVRVDPSGKFQLLAGTGVSGFSGDGGKPANADLGAFATRLSPQLTARQKVAEQDQHGAAGKAHGKRAG